jgi:MFS family permease
MFGAPGRYPEPICGQEQTEDLIFLVLGWYLASSGVVCVGSVTRGRVDINSGARHISSKTLPDLLLCCDFGFCLYSYTQLDLPSGALTTMTTEQNPGVAHDIGAPNVNSDIEKHATEQNANSSHIPANDDEYVVTFKTWVVVSILALSYGISFWIVPSLSSVGASVGAQLGDATQAAWYISTYTMTVTLAFMVCGANSDLFGRRWFIIFGNVLLFIGFIVGGTAKTNKAMIAALALIGFGAGNAQLAAFALPELLPNKWRHSAVVIADIGVYFAVLVGPVAGRFSIQHGEAWRWLFYGPAIAVAFSFLGLYLYYYPPKHPRGLAFNEALKVLDYGGAFLFIVSMTLILTGIVYTTTLPSSDPKVIGTLVTGFILLVIFALYETFMPLKQPLTPRHVFTKDKGRELTAPFIVGFVVTVGVQLLGLLSAH